MTTARPTSPIFPKAPDQYNRQYMDRVVSSFDVFIKQQLNPGIGRFSTLTLTDLPTSPTGLEVGAVYNDSGTLKIVT